MENKKVDSSIVEKIQKLLAMTKSSNEHESKIALLKSQELLAKHKLSLREITDYKPLSNIGEKMTDITFTKAKWKGRLASIVADNFGCYNFINVCGSNRIVFLGREEDITVCNLVLQYAIDSIEENVKRIKYKYRKEGVTSFKGLENDYAIGFLSGLKANFEEQKKKNQEWGLVLIKDKEVVEAFENKEFSKKKLNLNSGFNGFNEAYNNGIKDGKNFSVSDKISNSGSGSSELSLG